MSKMNLIILVSLTSAVLSLLSTPSLAQNISGVGQTWSGTWGFESASDRSIALQRAQMIKTAEQGADPTTVNNYETYYDNRSNYIETNNSGAGSVAAEVHNGDEIGTNTNAVGAMNTGSTTITLSGDGNNVSSNNSADTSGCIDGSVSSTQVDLLPGFGAFSSAGTAIAGGSAEAALGYGVALSGTGVQTDGCN